MPISFHVHILLYVYEDMGIYYFFSGFQPDFKKNIKGALNENKKIIFQAAGKQVKGN